MMDQLCVCVRLPAFRDLMKFVELPVILHVLPVDLLPGSFCNDSYALRTLR